MLGCGGFGLSSRLWRVRFECPAVEGSVSVFGCGGVGLSARLWRVRSKCPAVEGSV